MTHYNSAIIHVEDTPKTKGKCTELLVIFNRLITTNSAEEDERTKTILFYAAQPNSKLFLCIQILFDGGLENHSMMLYIWIKELLRIRFYFGMNTNELCVSHHFYLSTYCEIRENRLSVGVKSND